jgi:hypothetical protein
MRLPSRAQVDAFSRYCERFEVAVPANLSAQA